jgi:hypothetical protein
MRADPRGSWTPVPARHRCVPRHSVDRSVRTIGTTRRCGTSLRCSRCDRPESGCA